MTNVIDRLPDSPALQLLRSCAPLPAAEALWLAADVIATQIVRGTAAARDLSDAFAAARFRLPLLNWPTPAVTR